MNRRRTILIADDDEDDRFLVKSALEDCQITCSVKYVENGVEVINYLENGEGGTEIHKPSLILLDLNMPKKDGREALREIKNNPELRSIPVIILTTSKATEDVNLCYGLGANGYIVKPNSFSELANTLKILTKFWLDVVTLPPL
ncbi:CheY-like chemotaxis protein [Arcicella aurantiaca]|uniref:CheY-like chemotaxis protein n=1 Tax=Arcicella aurantiaca TaxID=591202 RepID=A0A316E6A9_9BACT|nr:response regulator [Arcicella aurantiaca]PWK25168.1 CheY-like chemotaxis protein [Arcicella aurantiaca]